MVSDLKFNHASGSGRQAYEALKPYFARIKAFDDAYEVAHAQKWLAADDAQTEAAVARMTSARLSMIGILNNPDNHIDALLQTALDDKNFLEEMDQGNLARMKKIRDEMLAFKPAPGQTIEEKIRAYETPLGMAEQGWIQTLDYFEDDPQRTWDDQIGHVFSSFKTVCETMRPVAAARGLSVYEACLQKLAPDQTTEKIDGMFAGLKKNYKNMAERIHVEDAKPENMRPLPIPTVDDDVQKQVFEVLKRSFLEAGDWTEEELKAAEIQIKMGTAQTGFSWGAPNDITLAIETSEGNFIKSLGNTAHECGHLLYLLEMNRLGKSMKDQPVAIFNGFGAHEFSSMFFEMAALRKPYFNLATPAIHEILSKNGIDVSGPEWSAENLYQLSNRPNFSDTSWGGSELVLTPNMAFRYEAERDIMNAMDAGDDALAMDIIRDLPSRWAQTMKDYLGVPHDPADYAVGESHWFEGLIGYFPSYMEGAHAAAQMHQKIAYAGQSPDHAKTLTEYLKGYYDPMRDFFRKGASYAPAAMIADTVGGPMNSDIYLARLGASGLPGMPAPDAVLAASTRQQVTTLGAHHHHKV